MKKPENANANANNTKAIKVDSYRVLRAVCVGENNTVLFDLELNGVKLYGLKVVEGKNGDFIGFPSKKAKNGEYYSLFYAQLSADDQKAILAAVEAELNQ